MKQYKFGYAANCSLTNPSPHGPDDFDDTVGGVSDGETAAICAVSDDLIRMEQHLLVELEELGNDVIVNRNHHWVIKGYTVDDLGDAVVSVIQENEEDGCELYVIFANPQLPTVI